MRFTGRKNIQFGIMVLSSTMFLTTCFASVTFNNVSSGFSLNATNAKLYVNNASKITGWGQNSIVKAYGNNASSSWLESYVSNAVVGNASLSGVTKPTRTNLVDANSNAINITFTSLRTTSNLLLYTARTYSSSLFVLRSRADSANLTMGTASNQVNQINQSLVVPTADSVDGTVFPKYCTKHYVFHNNGNAWSARGWVRFNDGFTIMPLGSVIMDTLVTVSGAIDLRDTGTLILNNDLYLAHNVTLTNGGNIKGQASSSGQANTIFMGGDLTLAEDSYARTFHITGDWSNSGTSGNLIIDGCGHTLNIGNRAQIFVDQNITLTLRNMTIKTGPKSLNNPAIQLASFGSKLALDNVMFDLGADFHFITGQLFVHNEVAVTGTSAFVYQSPVPSYITSGATWSFEQGTTFSVAPSTFTDCPFTVNNTYTNNAFLVLADASSALSLNGCSFQTTFTGLRLRSGMVLFDNKVAIDTTAGVDLNNTTPITEIGSGVAANSSPSSVSWSPDGRYLAVACINSDTLRVYRFDGSSVPVEIGTGVAASSNPNSVSWSPDGRYLAVICWGTEKIRIYRFNGSSVPVEIGTGVAASSSPQTVSWSPDGRYLAVACFTGSLLRIYKFNGLSVPVEIGTGVAADSNPRSAIWSPDGRYLAVVCQTGGRLRIYRFNGSSIPVEIGTGVAVASDPFPVSWSPDGRYLAVTCTSGSRLRIYRFNGSSVPVEIGNGVAANSSPYFVSWSPDGRYLAVNCYTGDWLRMYKFDGSSIPVEIGTGISVASGLIAVSWSPDGRYLAATCNNSSQLRVFRCNYYYTGQSSANQGFSNGLVFGDKLKGSSFDANVQVLSGASVKVKGMVKDDSV